MKFLRTALWYSFLAIMCPIWLALFCGILFLFLISLAWETWDMSRMREQAVSTFVSVEVEQGHRGSRPIITYTYTVGTCLPGRSMTWLDRVCKCGCSGGWQRIVAEWATDNALSARRRTREVSRPVAAPSRSPGAPCRTTVAS